MTEPETALSEAALQELISRREKFFSFVRKHVGSAEDAEDIVQAAFVRGIEKGDAIRDDESAVAWFYRVLRNAIIDHYRRRAANDRKAEHFAREFEDRVEPDDLTRNEICQCILPVLDSLKPEYRDALKLVDIDQRPLRDLAQSGSISENNAAVRVHRARQSLRKNVQMMCGACATHGCINCTCKSSAR